MDLPIDVPMIDQVKIQSRVLVPIVKVLEKELGTQKAHALMRSALDEESGAMARQLSGLLEGSAVEKVSAALPLFSGAGALDVDLAEQTGEVFRFNVTGCRYAEHYQELGEPELGYLFCCKGDEASARAFSPDLEFIRTQTIMEGASHCDFCYKMKET